MQFNFAAVNLVVWHLRFCRSHRGCEGLFHWAGGQMAVNVSNLREFIDEWWCLSDFMPKMVNLHTEWRPDVSASLFSSSCSILCHWMAILMLLRSSTSWFVELPPSTSLRCWWCWIHLFEQVAMPEEYPEDTWTARARYALHFWSPEKMNHFPEVSSERLFLH